MGDRLVVDSSVVMKLFIDEEYSEDAHRLFEKLLDKAPPVFFAPDLMCLECSNVLLKHVTKFAMPLSQAERSLSYLSALPLTVVPSTEIFSFAYRFAVELGITAYDAAYVAISEMLGCEFITADKRLADKVSGRIGKIKWLGDL